MTGQRRTELRVLLAGATGLVGGYCLAQLLADEDIGPVTVFARRPLARTDPKLTAHVVDFDHLDDHAEAIHADVALCCLGTTHRVAGSPEAFAKVDHIYVAELARLAAARGVLRFVLVSAVGADPGSPVFYNRIKGRAEAAVSELPFKAVHVLRPSLLLGERLEPRPAEDWSKSLAPLWSLLLWGSFSRYRPVAAEIVAARMVELAKSDREGVHVHYFNAR
ncbi:MAG: NAD(P)H-binding protein [Candidatus Contendobacter sp.]|nr:NAD(P)H-binding protein [Candidatus Contendobacter sp.]MDG4558421.1 NAD(P)H-binding protein [Candidatus Contendobacter sp.]